MELCGVLLAVKIKRFIFQHSRQNFERVFYIVDSEIVRAMIQKDSYGFNTFAGVRLGEIQETEDPKNFYWVAGGKNIADLITRGCSPNKLVANSEWQRGPVFLSEDFSEWPVSHRNSEILELPPEQAKSKVWW